MLNFIAKIANPKHMYYVTILVNMDAIDNMVMPYTDYLNKEKSVAQNVHFFVNDWVTSKCEYTMGIAPLLVPGLDNNNRLWSCFK